MEISQRRIFVLLVRLFFTITLNAQSPIPVFRGSEKHTLFVNEQGAVQFTLPAGHRPIVGTGRWKFYNPSSGNVNESLKYF